MYICSVRMLSAWRSGLKGVVWLYGVITPCLTYTDKSLISQDAPMARIHCKTYFGARSGQNLARKKMTANLLSVKPVVEILPFVVKGMQEIYRG